MGAQVFERIVACVDGRPPGLRAGAVAIETAARFTSRITFVTVLPGAGPAGATDLDRLVPATAQGKTVQQVLEELETQAHERGVHGVDLRFLRGSPAEVLLTFLKAAPPDLVVVGTRGLSRGSRLLLGSVSSRLVTDAPSPVLVVREVGKPRKA